MKWRTKAFILGEVMKIDRKVQALRVSIGKKVQWPEFGTIMSKTRPRPKSAEDEM